MVCPREGFCSPTDCCPHLHFSSFDWEPQLNKVRMSWMISGLMGPTVQSGVGKPGIQSPGYLVCKEADLWPSHHFCYRVTNTRFWFNGPGRDPGISFVFVFVFKVPLVILMYKQSWDPLLRESPLCLWTLPLDITGSPLYCFDTLEVQRSSFIYLMNISWLFIICMALS